MNYRLFFHFPLAFLTVVNYHSFIQLIMQEYIAFYYYLHALLVQFKSFIRLITNCAINNLIALCIAMQLSVR